MNDSPNKLSDIAFPISGSNIYQRWLDERENISKNRWYLSEIAGHDVGWDHARWDWDMRFRSVWLKARASGVPF